MPNRDEVKRKILVSSICPEKKPQAVNDGKKEQPGKCYELQSRLSTELPKSGHHLMDMQSTAHPPVERLNTNVECRRQNRFVKEMFIKYPFMLPLIQDSKQEMADEQVGNTSYRLQYKQGLVVGDPNEVIAELERGRLSRTSMASWKPECGTIRFPDHEYRGGSKINFTQNEWGPRRLAAEKQADETTYLIMKEPKYPSTSEYQANIESMAKFIIREDIFRKERIVLKRNHTLPVDRRTKK